MTAILLKIIIFLDKAQFHLRVYVNKQNWRIWDSVNQRVVVEYQMHSQHVAIWCGFRGDGIIGSFSSEMKTVASFIDFTVSFQDQHYNSYWDYLSHRGD